MLPSVAERDDDQEGESGGPCASLASAAASLLPPHLQHRPPHYSEEVCVCDEDTDQHT